MTMLQAHCKIGKEVPLQSKSRNFSPISLRHWIVSAGMECVEWAWGGRGRASERHRSPPPFPAVVTGEWRGREAAWSFWCFLISRSLPLSLPLSPPAPAFLPAIPTCLSRPWAESSPLVLSRADLHSPPVCAPIAMPIWDVLYTAVAASRLILPKTPL